MISIKNIAELAGVSRGTVDRVLNNRGGVNKEAENTIRRLVEEYGYKSNRAALALAARKKPLKIGAIFPAEGNAFFDDVMKGLRAAEQAYADNGVSILRKTSHGFSEEVQLRLMDELCEEGIQALVLAPVNEKAVANKINKIIGKGIPVVTANTDIENTMRLCYVGSDYEKSGEIVAGLIGLIADGRAMQTVILTGSIHVLGHNQRIIGCNRVIRKSFPNITILDVFETLDDTETAYRVTMKLLQKYKNLDAIYMTAGGVGGTCRALADTGAAGHIKVFTHDCTAESRPFLENGTIYATISQDPFQQGYLPVKILFDYFLDKQLPESELHYTRAHIIIRESL